MKARVERCEAHALPHHLETAFLSPRRELRGWGRAATIEIPAPWPEHLDVVGAVLGRIDLDDDIGTEAGLGPVAFGALPFDREAPARLVVPAVSAALSPDGAHWRTTIDGATCRDHAVAPVARSLRVETELSAEEWMEKVRSATTRIARGDLVKVVLARRLMATSDEGFDPQRLASGLFRLHPHSLRFCIDGMIGASPELLVSRIGDVVRAHPMAGTIGRSGDPAIDARSAAELLASAKNREEHQITIDAVHDTLLRWCSYLDAEPEPSVASAGSVAHLATMVEGRLSHPVASVLDLVAALHPTPAVGGWPRGEALDLIKELEPSGRGRYAGPVGWVDRHGNGSFAVGIRSMDLSEDHKVATLHAGVGVVADSDPRAELEETRAKFRATLPVVLDI